MKDRHLICEVEGDELVIRIGVDTLLLATQHCPLLTDDETYKPLFSITNADQLAADVARELNEEEEDGTTPLHRVLDQAMFDAMEKGSEAFEIGGEL